MYFVVGGCFVYLLCVLFILGLFRFGFWLSCCGWRLGVVFRFVSFYVLV
jgi:hypothetical protein